MMKGGNTAYHTGLPNALEHPLCDSARQMKDLFLPGLRKRTAEFNPQGNHTTTTQPNGAVELYIVEEALPNEKSCAAAMDLMFSRLRKELGDFNRPFEWRIPVETDIYIRPVYRVDSNGSHIDPITDMIVAVDGSVVMFKAYCRFVVDDDVVT